MTGDRLPVFFLPQAAAGQGLRRPCFARDADGLKEPMPVVRNGWRHTASPGDTSAFDRCARPTGKFADRRKRWMDRQLGGAFAGTACTWLWCSDRFRVRRMAGLAFHSVTAGTHGLPGRSFSFYGHFSSDPSTWDVQLVGGRFSATFAMTMR